MAKSGNKNNAAKPVQPRLCPRSLGSRNFSAQIAEKPVSFGDTFCVHSYGYELEGITKRSSPFGNLASKIS
jgi:hypothetical protein